MRGVITGFEAEPVDAGNADLLIVCIQDFVAAHQFGRLEPVHVRHLHVQKNQGEVVVEQQAQGLLAGGGADDVQVRAFQEMFQGQQVLRAIVHDQDVKSFVHGMVQSDGSGKGQSHAGTKHDPRRWRQWRPAAWPAPGPIRETGQWPVRHGV